MISLAYSPTAFFFCVWAGKTGSGEHSIALLFWQFWGFSCAASDWKKGLLIGEDGVRSNANASHSRHLHAITLCVVMMMD